MEQKVEKGTVNFRAVVKAESAAFLGLPDLALRHMRRVGTNYFRLAGENEVIPFQNWKDDFVRNPKARILIGAMGRLAGAGIFLSAELRGQQVKIIGVDNEYITVLDSNLKEHSWIPNKAFISNVVLEEAGYEKVSPDIFVFKVEKLQAPLEAKLPGARIIAMDATQKNVMFEYKNKLSVYGFDKAKQTFQVMEYTGLYQSKEMLEKITGLHF